MAAASTELVGHLQAYSGVSLPNGETIRRLFFSALSQRVQRSQLPLVTPGEQKPRVRTETQLRVSPGEEERSSDILPQKRLMSKQKMLNS